MMQIAVEGAYAPALRLVLREPGFPPARSSPGFALGMAVPRLLVRPRRHPGRFVPRIAPIARSRKGTSSDTTLSPPIACRHRKKLDNPPAPPLSCAQMSTLDRLTKRLNRQTKKRRVGRYTIRLEESTYEALEALAKEHQRSISEVVREVLDMLAEEYRQKRLKEQPKEQTQQTSLFTPSE